jgi:hypothetical protein
MPDTSPVPDRAADRREPVRPTTVRPTTDRPATDRPPSDHPASDRPIPDGRPGRRRARLVRTGPVALTLAVAGLAIGLGAGPASAGGTPQAACPGGAVSAVEDVTDPLSGGPVHLVAGFYAAAGTFFPPATVRLCATVARPGKPRLRFGTGTCPAGYLSLGVPNDTPAGYGDTEEIRWGTLLPAGWYAFGQTSARVAGSWYTVCWSPSLAPPPTPPPAG